MEKNVIVQKQQLKTHTFFIINKTNEKAKRNKQKYKTIIKRKRMEKTIKQAMS